MGKGITQAESARRRELACRLFEAGMSQAEVARRCNVTRQSASRWYHQFKAGGAAALAPRRRGRRPALNPKQLSELSSALLEGPAQHGWSTDLWTLERITVVIKRLFGVRFHQSHAWRLLRTMGWSLQRPTTRARERDEAAIAAWKTNDWRRLKKKAEVPRRTSSSTKAGSRKAR